VQTTAYVAGRTESALASAGKGNLIERVTATVPRTDPWLVVISMGPPRGTKGASPLSSQKILRTTSWTYRGQTRTQGFTSSGQLAVDVGPGATSRLGGDQSIYSIIIQDTGGGQWFSSLGVPLNVHPSQPTCTNVGAELLEVGDGAAGEGAPHMSALISAALSCHLFRATGHQQVFGTSTVRLAAAPALLHQLHENNGTAGPKAALWVNTETFLPVRMVLGGDNGSADFTWLKPTKANLRALSVKVPAGVRHVRLPARSTAVWTVAPKGAR